MRDLLLHLNANTRQGGESNGFFTAFLDVTYSFRDRKTQDVVYEGGKQGVKGRAADLREGRHGCLQEGGPRHPQRPCARHDERPSIAGMTGLCEVWHAIGKHRTRDNINVHKPMKTLNTSRTITVLMTALMLSGAMTACKSKKKAAAAAAPPDGETEVKVLCSGPEYFTDNKVFRANAPG